MSELLFSSLQFKFAQCQTWMVKEVVKHKKLLNIFCTVYLQALSLVTNPEERFLARRS